MKKTLIVFIILIFCSLCPASSIQKRYKRIKEEQKYRYLSEIRQERQIARLRLIRAKNYQKIHRRYRRNSYRIYSQRACPK